MTRLVIIGGGPSGIAAGWLAARRGLDVTVVERGEPGASLRRWVPVRFFSPLRMNMPGGLLSELGLEALLDECLTAEEMREMVLEPATRLAPLAGKVRTRTAVRAVGRRAMTRSDYPAHPLRGERGFLLVVDSPSGEELLEADVVFDATGGYARPCHFGPGGLPAIGERALGARVIRDHATLAARLDSLAGRRVLLVGHGHSAANALLMLADSGARVRWSVRTNHERPCVAVANDPLPERSRVVHTANDYALSSASRAWLTVRRRSVVERVEDHGEAIRVVFLGGEDLEVDEIVSFTGYAPDGSHARELPLEISAVTEGTQRLWRATANVTDCLAVPRVSASDLETGEPDYWLVGGRSYGRARTFLLQTGLRDIETILQGYHGP